ncbi:MAG: acyl carrier protein [Alphaproteobacteria bacterium]
MGELNQETFNTVADIIAEVSSIDRGTITADAHAINDLGIDSLDFLDVTFAIDKKFGIKMPVEKWMEEVNEGKASADEFFVMRNLVRRIEELVAAKAAAA